MCLLALGKATIERWYHQGFATTLCDLRNHSVFDVVKGRTGKDIETYLQALPGKDKVKVICMDLSSTYRKRVRRYFPHAKIVDRRVPSENEVDTA
jgi:transposase